MMFLIKCCIKAVFLDVEWIPAQGRYDVVFKNISSFWKAFFAYPESIFSVFRYIPSKNWRDTTELARTP